MAKPEHVSVVLARIMARLQEGTKERDSSTKKAGQYVAMDEQEKRSSAQTRCRSGDSKGKCEM